MKCKRIVFTKKDTAEILTEDIGEMNENSVLVKSCITTISCGTEKANISGVQKVAGNGQDFGFPRRCGYSTSGIVEAVGENVTEFKKGDRVAAFWTVHGQYNIVDKNRVVKIPDGMSLEEAAVVFIGTFPMGAVRKTHFEVGESALVMGLGLLGQIAVKILRASGAVPLIAVDPVEERRKEALLNGADYAFSPFEPDFAEKVKAVSNGGVNVAIEVTGVGAGLDEALDCMAPMGRVSLLGCTRDSDFTIDYYRKVHFPGIELYGAHTAARPEVESYPAHFTHCDDMRSIMKLCLGGRMELKDMIKETHSPKDCQDVYTRLINEPDFPTVVQYDWRNFE